MPALRCASRRKTTGGPHEIYQTDRFEQIVDRGDAGADIAGGSVTGSAYLALKKLKGRDAILRACRHNLREIQAELGADSHIDASRTHLNQRIAGPASAQQVAALASDMLQGEGLDALRRDAVQGIEVVISLPVGALLDHAPFFQHALGWLQQQFAAPVLSAVQHQDEAAPHLHIIVLPLVSGKMCGSKLVGNKVRLTALQQDFYLQVAAAYGLARPVSKKRLPARQRQRLAGDIIASLSANPQQLADASVRQMLHGLLVDDPAPLATALGLDTHIPAAQKMQGFVDIMTRPVPAEKMQKPIGFGTQSKPIGFEHIPDAASKAYPSVGFARYSDTKPQAGCLHARSGGLHRLREAAGKAEARKDGR